MAAALAIEAALPVTEAPEKIAKRTSRNEPMQSRWRASPKRTRAEAVLKQTRQLLQVAHAAGSGGRPADGLLAPLDWERADD